MRHYLLQIILILCCFNSQGQEKKAIQPNIVFIMADDMGWSDLPAYGNMFNEAPNIDTLASQGMLFTNAYAAPVCSPSRASILSGQYPARVGLFDFIPGHWRPYEEVTVPRHENQFLSDNIVTLGEAMRAAGYKTGYFGKWHLGNDKDHRPDRRGFDETYIYAGNGYSRPSFIPEYENNEYKRLSDVLADMGIDFMKRNKDNPFFLFVSHYDVHVQLDADRNLIKKFLNKEKAQDYPSNAVYASMIEHVDRSVGSVMNAIEELGLAENTIFIFFSDNGGVDNRFDNIPLLAKESQEFYPEDHPLQYIATSNLPLRGGKGTLYEGGVRVPLIVKWPGVISEGTKTEAVVSNVDFYPTFIELARGKLPVRQIMDGFSLVPIWKNEGFDPEREVFTHYPVYHHEQPMSAVRKGDWKLIENLVSGEFDLYNLKFDVNEMTDLKFSYPEKLREMKGILKKWQLDTDAPMPVKNPDFDKERRYEWGVHPDRKH